MANDHMHLMQLRDIDLATPELNFDIYDCDDEHDHQLHAPIGEAEVALAFKRLKRQVSMASELRICLMLRTFWLPHCV